MHQLYLKEKVEFFTYQRKQDKSYKTVLRHIRRLVDLEEIKCAIEQHEHFFFFFFLTPLFLTICL